MDGAGGSVGNFASHLLTVNHVVITVCCPLVYLPPEDIGPLLVTIGPNNQLSVCPLSDVIYITGLSPLGCPSSACDQSSAPSKQRQNRPLTKQTHRSAWPAHGGEDFNLLHLQA